MTCNGGVLMVRSIPVMRNAPSRKTSQRSAEGLPWRIKLAFVPHRWPTPSREDGHRKGGVNSQNDLPQTRCSPTFWDQPARLKSSRSPRFSSRTRFRSPFRAEKDGKLRIGWDD